jgi:hypothetical protein
MEQGAYFLTLFLSQNIDIILSVYFFKFYLAKLGLV